MGRLSSIVNHPIRDQPQQSQSHASMHSLCFPRHYDRSNSTPNLATPLLHLVHQSLSCLNHRTELASHHFRHRIRNQQFSRVLGIANEIRVQRFIQSSHNDSPTTPLASPFTFASIHFLVLEAHTQCCRQQHSSHSPLLLCRRSSLKLRFDRPDLLDTRHTTCNKRAIAGIDCNYIKQQLFDPFSSLYRSACLTKISSSQAEIKFCVCK